MKEKQRTRKGGKERGRGGEKGRIAQVGERLLCRPARGARDAGAEWRDLAAVRPYDLPYRAVGARYLSFFRAVI